MVPPLQEVTLTTTRCINRTASCLTSAPFSATADSCAYCLAWIWDAGAAFRDRPFFDAAIAGSLRGPPHNIWPSNGRLFYQWAFLSGTLRSRCAYCNCSEIISAGGCRPLRDDQWLAGGDRQQWEVSRWNGGCAILFPDRQTSGNKSESTLADRITFAQKGNRHRCGDCSRIHIRPIVQTLCLIFIPLPLLSRDWDLGYAANYFMTNRRWKVLMETACLLVDIRYSEALAWIFTF